MNHQNTNQQDNSAKPTHSLRMKTESGNSNYETNGVGWEREDGDGDKTSLFQTTLKTGFLL